LNAFSNFIPQRGGGGGRQFLLRLSITLYAFWRTSYISIASARKQSKIFGPRSNVHVMQPIGIGQDRGGAQQQLSFLSAAF
jgi:hypothetical protein